MKNTTSIGCLVTALILFALSDHATRVDGQPPAVTPPSQSAKILAPAYGSVFAGVSKDYDSKFDEVNKELKSINDRLALIYDILKTTNPGAVPQTSKEQRLDLAVKHCYSCHSFQSAPTLGGRVVLFRPDKDSKHQVSLVDDIRLNSRMRDRVADRSMPPKSTLTAAEISAFLAEDR